LKEKDKNNLNSNNDEKNNSDLLSDDLKSYKPNRWKINLPFRNYNVRIQDFVPAISGVIGKVSLVAAFAVSWSVGLSISNPAFVPENVRLELVFAGFMTIIFCAVLNPYIGPPGTLAPLIPMVPIMAAAGVHPLSFGILVGSIGIILSISKAFSKVVNINGKGTKGGLIILFGILGIKGAIENLNLWAFDTDSKILISVIIIVGIILYISLNKVKLGWLVIPACAGFALLISVIFGKIPDFQTDIGFPVINPSIWWNEKWGTGFGFTVSNYIKALPYALFAVVLWPLDALAIKAIQDENYPIEAENAKFDMDSTYTIVSIRTIMGTFLGGSQTAAIWRSFMIPLSIIKRPIGASALILGVLSIAAGILGSPIDIAIFPPLLWPVLIFGVFVPMLEVGISTIKDRTLSKIAAICIVGGITINPLVGWILAMISEKIIFKRDIEKLVQF